MQLLRRKEVEIVGSIESSNCKDGITSSSSIHYQREKFVLNKNLIKTTDQTDQITYPEELKEETQVTIGTMIYTAENKTQRQLVVEIF